MVAHVRQQMHSEKARFSLLAYKVPSLFAVAKTRQEAKLDGIMDKIAMLVHANVNNGFLKMDTLSGRIKPLCENSLTKEKHRLELLSQRLASVDPIRLLERGYSITTYNGKAVTSIHQLSVGDRLLTRLRDGVVNSIVEKE